MPTYQKIEGKNTGERLRLPALLEYWEKACRRRAAAFCDAPEEVLGDREAFGNGVQVLPLTPRTYSMLIATESNFFTGRPIMVLDVRNYLWFHSPLYAHSGVKDWAKRKCLALAPFDVKIRKARTEKAITQVLLQAAKEIGELISDAFTDSPVANETPSTPLATLEAQFIDTFAREYQWEPNRTSNTPLRHLFQLHRCIRSWHGEIVADRGEIQIKVDDLIRKNKALGNKV